MSWITEHGAEYDVPAEILGLEVVQDESWHNDTCPHFTLAREYQDRIPDVSLDIWIEHPDEELREALSGRFCVQVYDCEGPDRVLTRFADVVGGDASDIEVSYFTDDIQDCVRTFTAWFRILRDMKKEMA